MNGPARHGLNCRRTRCPDPARRHRHALRTGPGRASFPRRLSHVLREPPQSLGWSSPGAPSSRRTARAAQTISGALAPKSHTPGGLPDALAHEVAGRVIRSTMRKSSAVARPVRTSRRQRDRPGRSAASTGRWSSLTRSPPAMHSSRRPAMSSRGCHNVARVQVTRDWIEPAVQTGEVEVDGELARLLRDARPMPGACEPRSAATYELGCLRAPASIAAACGPILTLAWAGTAGAASGRG
jgi:hypothetical protein